jgi:hypothetical protein
MADVMSESTGPFRCTICDLVVDRLPDESQQVGKRMGNARMFLIDGIPHIFVSTKLGAKKKLSAAKPQEEKQ